MADRISGGNTQGVQQQRESQEVHGKETQAKSPSSQILKGRGVQKDVAPPIRQSSSHPGIKQDVKQGGGKSWKERTAKLDGVVRRSKPSSTPSSASSKVSSAATSKTGTLPPAGMPAPYKGLRTLERGATLRPTAVAARATLSRSGSNLNDVRRGKFKEQFQQHAKDYDRRSSELKPFQQKIYQQEKAAISSLLKQNPGDALAANKQFSDLVGHARLIEDLFHGDSSYLAKLSIGDW